MITPPFPPVQQKTCIRCGAAFVCGQSGLNKPCWCAELPPTLSPDTKADCLCPACLKQHIRDLPARN